MFSVRLPSVRFLSATNLKSEYQHSILISVLRGLAAVEVVAAHLRAQLFPSLKLLPDPTLWYTLLAFFTGFAHQAVVVFFVLSGWLVGGSLLNKLHQPGIMTSYAIDRFTRIWIVLIPAFLLTVFIGSFTGMIDPSRVSYARGNEYSVTSFIGNLFGLQDMVVPRFGGNFSLWSLANEIWYYLLFPLLVLLFVAKSTATKIGSAVTMCVIGYCLSFQIVLYFIIWLLGVLFSRIQIDCSRSFRGFLIGGLVCVSVYFRLTGSNDILVPESFTQDLVCSVVFLSLLSSLQYRRDITRLRTQIAIAAGEWFAAFSFTLYVIHVPILVLLRHLHEPLAADLSPDAIGDFGVYLAVLGIIILIAYVFHLPFEAQTHRVRRLFKRVAIGGKPKGAGVVG